MKSNISDIIAVVIAAAIVVFSGIAIVVGLIGIIFLALAWRLAFISCIVYMGWNWVVVGITAATPLSFIKCIMIGFVGSVLWYSTKCRFNGTKKDDPEVISVKSELID